MRTTNDPVTMPDPVDDAALTQWSQAVAAARRAVAKAQSDYDGATAALNLGDPSSPASRAKATFTAAGAANVQADNALGAAQSQQATLQAAAATADAGVLSAQAALAAATQAVSKELGRLMASASTSALLTATVDGLALRERYRTGGATTPPVWDMATIPFRATATDTPIDPEVALPVLGSTDHAAVVAVLDALDDTVDAIADLVAAEGVHQLVGGNLVRSGAALDLAATGAVPDELEVVTTPVRGYDVTHRVLVIGEATPTAPWHAPQASLVGAVDPAWVAWLASLVPDPARVHLAAVALDGGSGAVLGAVDLTADTLGLDASDWLRVAADRGELAARVAAVARPRLAASIGRPVDGPVALGPAVAPPAGAVPFDAFLAACAAVRSVAGRVRALGPADLAPAGQDAVPVSATVEAAAVAAVTQAQTALTTLDADLAAAPTTATDALVRVLLRATALGLAEATPPLAEGPVDDAVLRSLAATARHRLADRLAVPPFAASAAGPDATLAAARSVLRTLCGAPVPLLLPVPLPSDAALRTDLREGAAVPTGATPAAVRDWLYDHARVRPALDALLTAYDTADVVAPTATLRVRATHRPRVAGAGWAGVDTAPAPGLVDLVVLRTGGAAVTDQVAGLAVDAWVQTVTAAGHDAALAFHFDEPDADPPQAVLVAVPPSVDPARVPRAWDLASLLGVVTSTIAQAADRAVAAELVPDASVQLGSGQ
jgi:hypothetical protein